MVAVANSLKGFYLTDTRNLNGWRVDWNAAKTYAHDFLNKPGTYFENDGEPDHPNGATYLENLSNQENYRVVNILEVQVDEAKKQLNYVGEILSPELSGIDFEGMLKDGLINYTSPGIWPLKFEMMGLTDDGRQALDVYEFRALHFSYINDPAYGKETAHTIGTCEGDGITCSRQLAAKLSIPLTAIADPENLSHLQEIPITPQRINTIWTPCKQKSHHAELIAETDTANCVANKIKIIMAEKGGEDMPIDQQLAIAYSACHDAGLEALHKDLQNKKDIDLTIVD